LENSSLLLNLLNFKALFKEYRRPTIKEVGSRYSHGDPDIHMEIPDTQKKIPVIHIAILKIAIALPVIE